MPPKVKANEAKFIGKPLSFVLGEIKQEIKRVFASPNIDHESLGYFSFYFVDEKKYVGARAKEKSPMRIAIYVKEPFTWDKLMDSTENRLKWTREDEKKYGNLTVAAVQVYGEVIE